MKKIFGFGEDSWEKAWRVNQKRLIVLSLWKAIENGDVNQLKKLIEDNELNVNKKKLHGSYLLETAIQKNQPKIVDYLLGIGAHPNIRGGESYCTLL